MDILSIVVALLWFGGYIWLEFMSGLNERVKNYILFVSFGLLMVFLLVTYGVR